MPRGPDGHPGTEVEKSLGLNLLPSRDEIQSVGGRPSGPNGAMLLKTAIDGRLHFGEGWYRVTLFRLTLPVGATGCVGGS